MATPTYTLIDSEVLASAAASVTFSSIPATYRDLVLVVDIPTTSGGTSAGLRFNSDSGTNYSVVNARGDGSSATSAEAAQTAISGPGQSVSTGTSGNFIFQIFDYSATDKHKPVLTRTNNAAGNGTQMAAHRWANTAAVTAIEILSFGTYPTASSFYLYGIEA